MAQDPNTNPPRENVTIIREGRGSGGVIVALLALVLVVVVAFWALGSRDGGSDAGISAAADKVGAAADKVGSAADRASDQQQQ